MYRNSHLARIAPNSHWRIAKLLFIINATILYIVGCNQSPENLLECNQDEDCLPGWSCSPDATVDGFRWCVKNEDFVDGDRKVTLSIYTAPDNTPGTLDPYFDDENGVMRFIQLEVVGEQLQGGEYRTIFPFTRDSGFTEISDAPHYIPYHKKIQLVAKGFPASSADDALPSHYPMSVGRTGLFSVREGDDTRALNLFFTRVNSFTPVVKAPTVPGAPGEVVSLPSGRYGASATPLLDGRVLVVGGAIIVPSAANPFDDGAIQAVSDEALLFYPTIGTFAPLTGLGLPRAFHTATLLPDGRVMIAGGISLDSLEPINKVEFYDPFAGAFAGGTPLQAPRARHQATLIQPSSDQYVVLFTGGEGSPSTWEFFDPNAGPNAFVSGGDLKAPRWNHRDVYVTQGLKKLHDAVYVIGGETGDGVVSTMEFFDAAVLQQVPPVAELPRGGKTLPAVSFNEKRGFVFVAGGFTDTSKKAPSDHVELFQLDANDAVGFTAVPSSVHGLDLATARGGHGAALAPNNDLIVFGGYTVESDGAWRAVRDGEVITERITVTDQPDGSQTMSISPIRGSVINQMPVGVTASADAVLETGAILILGGLTTLSGSSEITDQALLYTYDDTPIVQ
jgi:hypothetical protein